MEIDEIIYEEVMRQLENEIIEQFGEGSKEEIEALMDDFVVEEEGSLLTGLMEHPQLSKLYYSILGMKMLINLSPYVVEEDNLVMLEDILKENPDNRFFSFIWVLYKVCQYKLEGASDYQIAELFKKIFSDYKDLVSIDGFISGMDLFKLRDPGNWAKDLFAPIFEIAVINIPGKPALKTMLAEIYWWDYDYSMAIQSYSEVIDEIKFTHIEDYLDDDFTIIDYFNTVQNRGRLFQIIGNTSKALEDATFVIDNIPVEGRGFFLPAFFTRMRINIETNNIEAIQYDYLQIKDFEFTVGAYVNNFTDVLSFIEKHKGEFEALI